MLLSLYNIFLYLQKECFLYIMIYTNSFKISHINYPLILRLLTLLMSLYILLIHKSELPPYTVRRPLRIDNKITTPYKKPLCPLSERNNCYYFVAGWLYLSKLCFYLYHYIVMDTQTTFLSFGFSYPACYTDSPFNKAP